MKKAIKIVVLCIIIVLTIIALAKEVKAANNANSISLKNYSEEEQQQWELKYKDKIKFLENFMYGIALMIIFNIILFSILVAKNKSTKIDLIYKILQIIFLILIFILYRVFDKLPNRSYYYLTQDTVMLWQDFWRPIIMNYSIIIIAFNVFVSVFIKKKLYLLYNSIVFGIISVAVTENIIISILSVIAINILFLPIYLKNIKLKEE